VGAEASVYPRTALGASSIYITIIPTTSGITYFSLSLADHV
jgi:hypothetical protein